VVIREKTPLRVVAHNHVGCVFALRQSVTKEDAMLIVSALNPVNPLIFSFGHIRFVIRKVGQTAEEITLHNFDGIACRRPIPDSVIVGRAIFLNVSIGANANIKV